MYARRQWKVKVPTLVYREKQFQEHFSLYALVAPTIRAKQLTWWLCGDLKYLDDLAAEIFLNAGARKGQCLGQQIKLRVTVLNRVTQS
jgi:hypothetical protein